MHRKEENITENRTTQKTIPNIQSMKKTPFVQEYHFVGRQKRRYRNLKSEKSQDYSQKAQRNSTFANFISVLVQSDLQRHYL